MLIIGLALIVIAGVALRLSTPRGGKVRLEQSPLLQNVLALAITIAAAVGVVVTLIGLSAFA